MTQIYIIESPRPLASSQSGLLVPIAPGPARQLAAPQPTHATAALTDLKPPLQFSFPRHEENPREPRNTLPSHPRSSRREEAHSFPFPKPGIPAPPISNREAAEPIEISSSTYIRSPLAEPTALLPLTNFSFALTKTLKPITARTFELRKPTNPIQTVSPGTIRPAPQGPAGSQAPRTGHPRFAARPLTSCLHALKPHPPSLL